MEKEDYTDDINKLISVVADLEKSWKEIKKKHDLENIDCCVILKLEDNKITLK